MLVRMQSLMSGKINEMEIPVTLEEVDAWRRGNKLIQEVFPHLTPDQREFLMTGSTPEEWNACMPEEDEADVHFGEDEQWDDGEPF